MATKYSDFISIRQTRPAYNIGNESDGEWKNFIPNEQFNSILQKVIRSVYCNDQDAHKSFWIDGTYGTGKSHAVAVIKHLLCDDVNKIRDYIDEEYKESRFNDLREALYDLRSNKKKRLFPVNMYAGQNIAQRADLSHELQRAIKVALKEAGIDQFYVKTDFDNYAEQVEKNPDHWSIVISKNHELSAYTPNVDVLVRKLREADTNILTLAKQAISQQGLGVRLQRKNLCDWFFEVQDELAKHTEYSGLLIIWDEFTDLMRSDIGPSLLVDLQEITERAMEMNNNSYFFFISHPSALDRLDAQEREKTKGRYHYMKYRMETVSAFKIMSRKFQIIDKNGYENIKGDFYQTYSEQLSQYVKDSNDVNDTLRDLSNLYPIHPATANLATYYARVVGSSSRSVFEFIGDNVAVRDFLDNEEFFSSKALITADYLWDFVLEIFSDNHIQYGAVTERYNSYKIQVENYGKQALAVFKGILLLNALNNVAGDETVTPSEENINNLFCGTSYEGDIDQILNWLNEQSIVQRAPGGLFSIQFTALPPKEIEQAKIQMREQFKLTSSIVNFGKETEKKFNSLIGRCSRPINKKFYSTSNNEAVLLNQIEKDYRQGKPWELFLSLFFGVNETEVSTLKDIAKRASSEPRFENVVFLVFDQPFGDDKYARFIEYMANAQCAASHSLLDQRTAHEKNATEMIRDWMNEVSRQNVSAFIRGNKQDYSSMRLGDVVSKELVLKIFNLGAESLDILRSKAPNTFWAKMNAKKIAQDILVATSLDEVIQKLQGPNIAIRYLLQDAVDENLKVKSDADTEHPLLKVNKFIEDKIRRADPTRDFNFADKFEDLTNPPYGIFPSYAGYTLFAYSLRQWIGKIYSIDGKPRLAQHLVDDIFETFKIWESGKNSNKVTFTFETKEAGQLCNLLVKTFRLNTLPSYKDISSLKDARWAVTKGYSKEKGYPLWVLKYVDGIKPELIPLIDKLYSVVTDVNINKNPALMSEAIELLNIYGKLEFSQLLNTAGNFENGYCNFLCTQQNISVTADEIDDAKAYIKGHLQLEVGFWNEDEVLDKLKDWKIQSIQERKPTFDTPLSSITSAGNTGTIDDYSNEPQNPSSDVIHPDKNANSLMVSQAIDNVNRIQDLHKAQSLLRDICEFAGDEILELIIEY
ncbi:hypothetical protein ACTML9_01715 [Porphyromonas levii]|nr:hypothetical protein [Porphyromonas levii]TFH95381.1 hypothetical protein E4P48_08050 [Porphyromonas levii]